MGIIAKSKTFLASKFYLLYYLYKQLGNKFWFILVLNCIFVFLDGVGIAMFVPLLQVTDTGVGNDASSGALMQKLRDILQRVGIELNLPNIILLIFVLFTTKALFYFWSQYYQNKIMMDFVKNMRLRNNEALRKLNYKSFLKRSFGDFHRTLAEEPGHVQEAAISYIDTLKNIFVVLIYLAFSSFFDIRFTFLVIICGGLIYGVFHFINKKIKTLSRNITAVTQKHSGLTAEKIYNFKYLKATGALNHFITRMERFDEVVYNEYFSMAKLNIFNNVIREPLLIYTICILIIIQVQVLRESMASMIVVLLLFYRTMGYLMSIQSSWSTFLKKLGSVENMLNFERFLLLNKEQSSGSLSIRQITDLKLSNVSFGFDNHQVLHDINLGLKKNSTLALVGESGSGKSTLVNIICGLYTPDAGQFLINGIESTQLSLTTLQQRIGYITQDATVFAGTVFENVTLWQEKTPETIEKFWHAAEKSNLAAFINSLPAKENAVLGQNGINLSGGQKQRVSIARELYKEIDLLIMDEATSALDAHTENEIQESIEHLRGEMMMIIIAHRLATVRSADKLVLLEKGRITGCGTFGELKQQSAYFRRMADLQGL